MSEYQNVVGGKLKLKGKALDVKEGGVKKKKKKKHQREEPSHIGHDKLHEGGSSELPTDPSNELTEADKMGEKEGNQHLEFDHLTPAERRYMEQKQKIDMQKLAKVAQGPHPGLQPIPGEPQRALPHPPVSQEPLYAGPIQPAFC